MSLEHTVLSLPGLSLSSLERIAINCARALGKDSADTDARTLCDAVDAEYLKRTGVTDGWTPGRQGEPRLFVEAGVIRGALRRINTHTSGRKDVYVAELDGGTVARGIATVDVARVMLERMMFGTEPA